MDVITVPKICKPMVVYQFYCMGLFHYQTQCHMIIVILTDLAYRANAVKT